MVAEADDALMEKFFEDGTLTQEELTAGLVRAIRAGKLFPVFCASGMRNIGLQPLLNAIVTYVPSPAERPFAGIDAEGRRRDARRRRQGAARPVGVEDDRRPVRRAASRCSAWSPACSRPTRPSTTSRATSRNASATCWSSRARRRRTCPSCTPATSARWPS